MAYRERNLTPRKAYLRLRERWARRGKTFVYIAESGFEPAVTRRYASAPRGARVQGLISGRRRPRTSLIAARIGEDCEEPLRFEGSCNAEVFNGWLERPLCPRLNDNPVVVMANVPFHKGAKPAARIRATGAIPLFLPAYSPDCNPIEHDFAAINKIREYHASETLDTILRAYR